MHIFLLLVRIQGKRGERSPIEVQRQEIAKRDLAFLDEFATLWSPEAIENCPPRLLRLGHPAFTPKERQGKEIGDAGLRANGYIEVVDYILTSDE